MRMPDTIREHGPDDHYQLVVNGETTCGCHACDEELAGTVEFEVECDPEWIASQYVLWHLLFQPGG